MYIYILNNIIKIGHISHENSSTIHNPSLPEINSKYGQYVADDDIDKTNKSHLSDQGWKK